MISSDAAVLVAGANLTIVKTLSEILRRKEYAVRTTTNGGEVLQALESRPAALVILDLGLPGADVMALIRTIVHEWPGTPILALAERGAIETAVAAMGAGVVDFTLKPVDGGEMLARVSRSLDHRRLSPNKATFNGRQSRVARGARELIGQSEPMRRVRGMIERVAESSSVVLLEGEPGTGKELIALAIHDGSMAHRRAAGRVSSQADAPYLAVNCGAFAPSLLESQLFGHKKGSFTGADSDQEGLFAAAGEGTLFLDEITEITVDLQAKLLRAIQEREFIPVGRTQALPVRARIITATNRPIAALVDSGHFRADLYYRINVVNILVPPLRERMDDLPLLVDYLVRVTAERCGKQPRVVSDDVMSLFRAYRWPGNVRELENVIERAYALGRHEGVIEVADLPDTVREPQAADRGGVPSFDEGVRDILLRALRANRGIKMKAAASLGMNRNRLDRLIRRHGIPRELYE